MTPPPTPAQLLELQAGRARRERRLSPMQPGAQFQYSPRDAAACPHAGETVTVVRAPRLDVQNPTVRIRYPDGTEQSVPPQRLKKLTGPVFRDTPPAGEDPQVVQDARARPGWKRLLGLIDQLEDADRTGQPREPLDEAIRHRTQQMAGTLSPRGTDADERAATAAQLRTYAELDAIRRRAQQPGRGGRPAPTADVLPAPTQDTPQWLDQQQRKMINAVAKAIRQFRFISDRDKGRTVHVPKHVRRAVREAGRSEDRNIEDPTAKAPRASELHLVAADAYRAMIADALDVCQLLAVGKDREARALIDRQQTHRIQYALAQRQIEALRPQVHTGRFFDGDILSVRDEHAEFDEEGTFIRYHGMTQYYTRLTVIYALDGYSVTIANAHELESRTATRAGDQAWRDLGRWIDDTCERQAGKRSGRRQDDDDTLIYRDNEGTLRLRESIQERYPRLVDALEVIRRSLEPAASDVLPSEIPGDKWHPVPGYHEYERPHEAQARA